MDEVGARESKPVLEGVPQAPTLDEHARHCEAYQREPGERDEVDAREDEHARGGERQERDRAHKERSPSCVSRIGRERHRPDVAERERERPDDDPPTDARAAVEERSPDREGGRRNPEPQPEPEPVPVELDRVGDQLPHGPLGWGDLGHWLRHVRDRIYEDCKASTSCSWSHDK